MKNIFLENSKIQLLKKLNSDNDSERIFAVDDIIESGDIKLLDALICRLVKEKNHAVKDAIVFALKNMEDEINYDDLFDLYLSDEMFLRNAAVDIMGSFTEQIVPFLNEKLKYSDKDTRKLILDTLVKIGGEKAIVVLRSSLCDHSINVVITAVEYLTRLGDVGCVDSLIDLFNRNEEPLLRIAIIEALIDFNIPGSYESIINVLKGNHSLSSIESFYNPWIYKLIASFGSKEEVIETLNSFTNVESYAEEILYLYSKGVERFSDKFSCESIPELLISVAKMESLKLETRLYAMQIIGCNFSNIQKSVFNEINTVSNNHDIRQFCNEILDQSNEK